MLTEHVSYSVFSPKLELSYTLCPHFSMFRHWRHIRKHWQRLKTLDLPQRRPISVSEIDGHDITEGFGAWEWNQGPQCTLKNVCMFFFFTQEIGRLVHMGKGIKILRWISMPIKSVCILIRAGSLMSHLKVHPLNEQLFFKLWHWLPLRPLC